MYKTNPAVMASRYEPLEGVDDFPTPPWATRALIETLGQYLITPKSILEPACGRGHMAQALRETCERVYAADLIDYGFGGVSNFLALEKTTAVEAIITNPPFKLAEAFITQARRFAPVTCMLVRSSFLETTGRYERLYSRAPPFMVAQFTERVPMLKGRCLRFTLHKGKLRRASTATSYAWLIWRQDVAVTAPIFSWIAPCKERLERWGDYDDDKPGYSHHPPAAA